MLHGILLIDKPINISSYDVIRYLKRIINQKIKIGHAGTLDPFASGLLIIGFGKALKQFNENFLKLDKEYRVTGKLGEFTDTLDCTGTITQKDSINLTKEHLEDIFLHFDKEYIQVPPTYSALKYKGKPLYEYSRRQQLSQEELNAIVRSKARNVKLFSLELINFECPFFTYKAHVSSGTYIRVLTQDIAQKAHTHATTYELRRTKIGPYALDNAVNLYTLIDLDTIINHLI